MTILQTAEELARLHVADDPETTEIYMADSDTEVRLVEVSTSMGPVALQAVLPFRFGARPEKGIHYPSTIVLLSPSEWEAVKMGALSLPEGWDVSRLRKVH